MTLLELLQLLREHLKLVVVLPIACALVMAVASMVAIPNEYTATTSMYVLSGTASESDSSVSSTTLSASQMITNDVATLLESDAVQDKTVQNLRIDSLAGYDIDVESETTTRVLTLSVSGADAQSTAAIANELAKNVSSVAQDVMKIEAVNVIDEAATPTSPSGPNRPLYIMVAFLAGLFVAIALVVLMDMLNTRVRNADDVEKLLGVPVIGRMPELREGEAGRL